MGEVYRALELRLDEPMALKLPSANLDPKRLDADAWQRPASARSLIAAFPWIDPLAAVLAAAKRHRRGWVAGAGRAGTLKPPFATALFLFDGLITVPILAYRQSWLSG
jgi:hypothetical protein